MFNSIVERLRSELIKLGQRVDYDFLGHMAILAVVLAALVYHLSK